MRTIVEGGRTAEGQLKKVRRRELRLRANERESDTDEIQQEGCAAAR